MFYFELDDEDILIDGGNTNYQDTIRRNKTLAESGVNFIGMGVSGGEVGALTGPSLMLMFYFDELYLDSLYYHHQLKYLHRLIMEVRHLSRNKTLAESGVNFIGMGVSGGEVGALTGPSLMPGATFS
jgi:6-phosphogluconate dehydrogenase